ncbi:hypothetical protein [Actinoplanes subglobosus]|uniref:Uncharacterized protein n=1 Tax=Actinoplanes subglobosus TaxID=1547892 RepID=A0ABV8IM00_9ACTN
MSVFRAATNDPARRPAPAGHRVPQQRTHDHDYPDGPTEPLGAAPPAQREAAVLRDAVPRPAAVRAEPAAPAASPRRGGVAAAVLFSLVALLVSGAAAYFSWRTLVVVRALEPAHRLPVVITPEKPVPVAESVAVPVRGPERYPVAYAKEPIRLQPACSAVMHVDLDEPRAAAAEALADLRYESGCGDRPPQLSLGPGAAGGSREASADTDAAGCDRAIRTSPLGRGLPVEIKKGTAVCVLTAATPAELVLVEIIDVGGSGTAGLRATSWQVP